MKNAKRFLSIGIALAIALFTSIEMSAMKPFITLRNLNDEVVLIQENIMLLEKILLDNNVVSKQQLNDIASLKMNVIQPITSYKSLHILNGIIMRIHDNIILLEELLFDNKVISKQQLNDIISIKIPSIETYTNSLNNELISIQENISLLEKVLLDKNVVSKQQLNDIIKKVYGIKSDTYK